MIYDVAVIGAGPGGYQAALTAQENGLQVVLIEKSPSLGGTCLNVGCIPSKALLHYSELFSHVKKAPFSHCEINYGELQREVERVVGSISHGMRERLNAHKITTIQGSATLTSATTIDVDGKLIQAKKIILATGSEPIELPFLPFDEKRVLSSSGALFLKKIPESMLVVGGGVIGVEIASLFSRLGTRVTIVEMLPTLCSNFDRDIVKALEKSLHVQGVELLLSEQVVKGKVCQNSVELVLKEKALLAEVVLVAIGRRPNFHALGLEKVGVQFLPSHHIEVDHHFQTTLSSLYAIGDLTTGPQLAHRAEIEGRYVAEFIAGKNPVSINYFVMPNVIYSFPEAASIGLTEEEVASLGREYKVGKASLRINPRAMASGVAEGFVKVLSDKETGKLLGMHLFCPQASELIQIGMVALSQKMRVDELYRLPFAHPTLAESIKEACKS